MLVTAWLIGETFASGPQTSDSDARNDSATKGNTVRKALQLFIGMSAFLLAAFVIATYGLGIDAQNLQQTLAQNLVVASSVLGGILATVFILVLFSQTEIIGPYARGIRTILSNLPLWVMFLTCMATSVFFSFDSLFSTIFPENERSRAGSLRTGTQVAGVIADLETQIEKHREETAKQVFAAPAWTTYENKILRLVSLTQNAQDAIKQREAALQAEANRTLADKKAALSKLTAEKDSLTQQRREAELEMSSLDKEVAAREQERAVIEKQIRAKKKEITIKQAEAKAEIRGVGGSGTAGEGPKYRALSKAVSKLEIDIDALKTQLTDANRAKEDVLIRKNQLRAKLTALSQKVAALDAKTGIDLERPTGPTSKTVAPDPTGTDASVGLEKTIAKFRQDPKKETLSQLQTQCANLLQSVSAIPALKPELVGLNCAPDEANEQLAKIFLINSDLKRFQTACGRSVSEPQGTDNLLTFAKDCIQISGLPSRRTENFRAKLGGLALNRDDRAHRFVVTWNAFSDGNRLAYLALAIAIAVDALVFMSGLFGAAATLSPLKESPGARNRSIAQLQEIIDNALMPEKAYAAELALNVMHPVSDPENSGFVASIDIKNLTMEQAILVRKTLTAGATLGLVKGTEGSTTQFLVRSELFEYLSAVRAREVRLGNTPTQSAMPKYVDQEKEVLPKIDFLKAETKKIAAKKPARPLLEDKSSSQRVLDIEETRRLYILELLARMDLEQVDEQFLETLLPIKDRLEAIIRRWRRTFEQFNHYLVRKIDELDQDFDRAHRNIVDKWLDDKDTKYQISKIDKAGIKQAITIGECLPHIRDHLKRLSDDARLGDFSEQQEAFCATLDQARQLIDQILHAEQEEANPDYVLAQLESLRFFAQAS